MSVLNEEKLTKSELIAELRLVRAQVETLHKEQAQAKTALVSRESQTEQSKEPSRVRSYIDKAPYPMFVVNSAGRYVDANPAASILTGYSCDELCQLGYEQMAPVREREQNAQIFDELLATGACALETTILCKDGREVLVSLKAVTLGSDELLVFCTDITERREAERAAARLGAVLENSLNEIYVFDLVTLLFLEVNRGARENLGYSMSELAALTPVDIKPNFGQEEFSHVIAPLIAGRVEKIQFDTVHERKDGTHYPVEVHLQVDREGTPVFVAVVLDITKRAQAEAALQASQAQLRAFFEASPAGLCILDTKLRYQHVNQALAGINGVPVKEHLGRSLAEVLPLLAPVVEPLFRQVLDTGVAILSMEVSGRVPLEPTAQGSWSVSYFPIQGPDGRCQGLGGVIVDITDIKAAQTKHALLTTAIEQATDAIIVTDADGILQYTNPAFEAITGYNQSESIGQNASILKSGEQDLSFYEKLWDTLTSGTTWSGEFVNLRKDGTQYIEKTTISPVRNSAGVVSNYVAVKHDITEKRQAAAALRESEERFRLISENIDEVFWLGDPRTRAVLYVSDAFQETWQRKPQELYDDPAVWYDCIHPDDKSSVLRSFDAFLEGLGSYDLRFRILRPDGTERTVAMRGALVKNAEGMVVRVVGSTRDISNQVELEHKHKQLEEQYRQSQKMEAIGRLAGGVAHDFNNLLTVINSYAEIGADNLRDEDPLRKDLAEILGAGQRASTLTRQLLAFSRKQVMQPKTINLSSVVYEMEKMLQRLIGEDIEFSTVLEDVGSVFADQGQLEQVIMNLAVNARDAMPAGGRLAISTSSETITAKDSEQLAKFCVLKFRDTGIGMEAAVQQRIFEPFYTTKEVGAGTGLGLATVYGIVTQSQGMIEVESEVGSGTCFTIHLPLAQGDSQSQTKPRRAITEDGTETILLVEDEDTVRALTKRILGSAGYNVLTASNGDEALRLCDQHCADAKERIHLLISDVIMPRMRGTELVGHVGKRCPEIRVLYMSGYAGDAIADVLQSGCDFIAKPFGAAELLAKVKDVIEG